MRNKVLGVWKTMIVVDDLRMIYLSEESVFRRLLRFCWIVLTVCWELLQKANVCLRMFVFIGRFWELLSPDDIWRLVMFENGACWEKCGAVVGLWWICLLDNHVCCRMLRLVWECWRVCENDWSSCFCYTLWHYGKPVIHKKTTVSLQGPSTNHRD